MAVPVAADAVVPDVVVPDVVVADPEVAVPLADEVAEEDGEDDVVECEVPFPFA